jgi:uridine phosphorylase
LHLQPHQLAPTVILVGDPDRVPRVSALFDDIEYRVQKREFVTHTGRVGNKAVSVVSTGIGTDNIDIVLNELDALVNIDLSTRLVKAKRTSLNLIRIGTTGSIQGDLPIDTFLVSQHAIGLDGLAHFYGRPRPHAFLTSFTQHMRRTGWDFPIKPYFTSASERLIAQFGPEMRLGITATNSGFYAPQGRSLRIPARLGTYVDHLADWRHDEHKITNLEMETAGIYVLAQLMGHEAVSLNAILANRANGTFSQNPDDVVDQLIEHTLALL